MLHRDITRGAKILDFVLTHNLSDRPYLISLYNTIKNKVKTHKTQNERQVRELLYKFLPIV